MLYLNLGGLGNKYHFVAFAFDLCDPISIKHCDQLTKRLVDFTGNQRAHNFPGQKITLAIQRENATCIIGTARLAYVMSKMTAFVF